MSSIQSTTTLRSSSMGRWGITVLAAAAFLLLGEAMPAQGNQPSAQPQATPAAKKSPRHRLRQPEPPPASVEQPAPPPQPELPKWPVNDSPAKPSVTWDSSGLKIQANNASLHDILNQVSADTGAKVEGMGTDERVFGEYGPGTTRDVISQLLHGSSYNVLMIGDQGSGTPREIVLSARRAGSNPQMNRPGQPVEQPDEDVPDQPDDNDQMNQQPMINNGRPPMPIVPQGQGGVPGQPGMPGPPGAPRTPQQVLQELQQRQQQIQDQQQQQQQQH